MGAINARYQVLKNELTKLRAHLEQGEAKLTRMRQDNAKEEHDLSQSIMTLNNNIGLKKKEVELVDQERNRDRDAQQQMSNEQLDKINEIAKIMLIVDHLEAYCKYKQMAYKHNKDLKLDGLKYSALNNSEFAAIAKDFDNYAHRKKLTLAQLEYIEKYLYDFTIVIANCIDPPKSTQAAQAVAVVPKIDKKVTAEVATTEGPQKE